MTTQMQSTRATAQTGDPAVRLTELGIRSVDKEVVEAAIAFGAKPRQMLLTGALAKPRRRRSQSGKQVTASATFTTDRSADQAAVASS
jgi:hypothetical protein